MNGDYEQASGNRARKAANAGAAGISSRRLRDSLPCGLMPRYSTPHANAPIRLHQGALRLHLASGREAVAEGSVQLEWLPFPRVRFDVPDTGLPYQQGDLADATLEIVELRVACEVLVTGISISPHRCRGILRPPVTVGKEDQCDSISFGVANFVRYLGHAYRRGRRASARRLCLEAEGLRLTMDEVEEADDLYVGLKGEGGFALTHACNLERIRGGTLPFDNATRILGALHTFLSFARGAWCGTILPVGLLDGKRVRESWNLQKQTPWRSVESGFLAHIRPDDDDHLCKAFGGFLRRWRDPFWQDPVRTAVHWYVVSNTGASGVEGSIILAHTALELLGWAVLAEDPVTATMSRGQFNRLKAHEKIRSLLDSIGIPTDMPRALGALQQAAGQFRDGTSAREDGPWALAKLRHAFVHPKEQKRTKASMVPSQARLQAAELSLWYLELTLLNLFGYEGEYCLRFPLTHRLSSGPIYVSTFLGEPHPSLTAGRPRSARDAKLQVVCLPRLTPVPFWLQSSSYRPLARRAQ